MKHLALRLGTLAAGLTLASMATLAQAPAQQPQAAPRPTTAPTVKPHRVTGATPIPNWLEEHAYTLGVQAYVYALPWYYNSLTRWAWATRGAMKGLVSPPLMSHGVFQHQRVLTDASYQDGGRPNNDSTYSATWSDVGREPLIISTPDFGTRYFSVQITDFASDNIDYIGTRATGNRPGHYAIVGPDWKGTLPDGVKALKPAPTNWVFIIARILVDGPDDLPAVHKLEDALKITPLSQWGKAVPDPLPVYQHAPPFPRKDDPLADWKTINRAMTEIPPPARDAMIVKMFSQIGVGPGQDVTKMDPAIQRGLARAADMGRRIVTSGPENNVGRAVRNGWGMTPPNWGAPGLDGHFLVRSAKSLGGYVTHDPEENVYPAVLTDPSGELLDGSRRYLLRFTADEIPKVDAFWSLTVYDENYNLKNNPINRYSLGDRSRSMKLDADGGLTLYVQKDSPGADKEGNWLPTGEGQFHIVLRAYLPKPELLRADWTLPPLQRVQ